MFQSEVEETVKKYARNPGRRLTKEPFKVLSNFIFCEHLLGRWCDTQDSKSLKVLWESGDKSNK